MNDKLFVEICPNCKKRSDYIPNPAYLHICDKCKFECSKSDLIIAINSKRAYKEIKELRDKADSICDNLRNYPNYNSKTNSISILFPAKKI